MRSLKIRFFEKVSHEIITVEGSLQPQNLSETSQIACFEYKYPDVDLENKKECGHEVDNAIQ